MRFEFEPIESLPRLSWCACMRAHAEVARILHGPWVETRDDCFFEGAWNGPYETYRFDEATMLAGSGGRVLDGAILFASSGHMADRLYALTLGDELYVSNSFTFLLTQAGQKLDIHYPNYFFDFLYHHQCGIRVTKKPIRIQGRRFVYRHDCCNILVKPNLAITRIEKNPSDPPEDYSDYVAFLEQTVRSICENAVHPARQQTYRPLTTISQGYDSTAASVFAARAGCREAVTFLKSISNDGYVDDSGTVIAGYLGLETTEYERLDFNKLPGLPTAEFYQNPFGVTEALAVMQDQFCGSLLMTGIFGDYVWSTDRQSGLPLLQEPNTDFLNPAVIWTDFRLRVGFLHLPAPACGAIHRPAIQRITQSKEMAPWSLGGDYDRPIARRILEEAGVPRELFGQHKSRGAPWSSRGFSLSSTAGDRDFEAFYLTRVAGTTARCSSAQDHQNARRRKINRQRPLRKLLRRLPVRVRRALMWDRLDPRWASPHLYRFHWGFERTRERYQSALSQSR